MGVVNKGRFEVDIRDITRSLPRRALIKLIRQIVRDAVRSLVFLTPVDTGRAEGNWYVSVGVPSGESNYFQFGGENSIAQAEREMNEIRDPFTTIYITNNIHYIVRLEHGFSKKSAHMVALTINYIKAEYG